MELVPLRLQKVRDFRQKNNLSLDKTLRKEGASGFEKRGSAKGPRKGRPKKLTLSLEEEVVRLRAENELPKKMLNYKRR